MRPDAPRSPRARLQAAAQSAPAPNSGNLCCPASGTAAAAAVASEDAAAAQGLSGVDALDATAAEAAGGRDGTGPAGTEQKPNRAAQAVIAQSCCANDDAPR
mmetsp:Transcript_141421/g.352612  ORF Transcript_141421/g.352612 Transcript_141421/m.352612 type:complete len:102 (-) Transcript_141421:60-365(-)